MILRWKADGCRTLFHSSENWPFFPTDNPLDSYAREEVFATSSGAAENDANGKLYYFLKDTLKKFHRRISSSHVRFRLFSLDVRILPSELGEETSFDRIEVS